MNIFSRFIADLLRFLFPLVLKVVNETLDHMWLKVAKANVAKSRIDVILDIASILNLRTLFDVAAILINPNLKPFRKRHFLRLNVFALINRSRIISQRS